MNPDSTSAIVSKVWNYAHVLKNAGVGYGDYVEQITKKSNDEGIDGIISQDRLGLDVIYVQAKRWQNPIGRKEIQKVIDHAAAILRDPSGRLLASKQGRAAPIATIAK